MRSRRAVLGLAGLIAAGVAGCTGRFEDGILNGLGDGNANLGPPPETPADVPPALVQGVRAFGCDLLGRLDDANGCISPYSISVALAMTYAGATGETRTAMREALRVQLDEPELHEGYEALAAELAERADADTQLPSHPGEDAEDTPFTLQTANSVWLQEDYPFADAYFDLVDRHYGTRPETADFCDDPDAERARINDWVAEQTADRIEDLIPNGGIDTYARLVLANAIYFEASWTHPFDESDTDDATFTTATGEERQVQLMSQTGSFPHAVVDGHQVVDLPYAGNEVGMVVVLPADDLASLEADLDGALLAAVDAELESRSGRVALPRFEVESAFGLSDALEALGMAVAFDEEDATFDGMLADGDVRDPCTGEPAQLYVDEVFHDTFISVDEVGTEAAAATAVVMAQPVSGNPTKTPEPFEFVVDRPFLYLVRDRPTGTPLFIGRVSDASATQS